MTVRNLCVLALVAVVAVVAGLVSSTSATSIAAETTTDRFEYLIVSGGTTNTTASESSSMRKEPSAGFERESFPIERNLDKLGAKGWELVAVLGTPSDPVYYLKRRK